MALQTYVGSLTRRNGTGAQAVTGVGFTPKAVIFWSPFTGATGFDSSGTRLTIGFSDGTNHRAQGHDALDAANPTECARIWRNDKCLAFYNVAGTTQALAHIASLDADGFTLDWTTNTGTGNLIAFLAIGGSTVSASVGDFTSSGSIGNQSVTGLAFQPTAVMFCSAGWTSATTDTGLDGVGPIGIGWYGGSPGQGALSTNTLDNVTPTDTARYQRSDRCIARLNATNSGQFHEAAGVSLNTDGFTVNWLTAGVGRVAYLALRGVRVKAGVVLQPAATGVQSVAVGFEPKAVILASVGRASATSIGTDGCRISLGATDGTRQQAVFTGDEDNVAALQGCRYISSTDVLTMADAINATGASTTASARAALSAFTASAFSLNWSVADAVARAVLYLAMGDATVTTPPEPVIIKSTTPRPVLGGFGWTPQCAGGGTVDSAADLTESEDWDQ